VARDEYGSAWACVVVDVKVAHICPETGEHYIVTAVWDGHDYKPSCGHCKNE